MRKPEEEEKIMGIILMYLVFYLVKIWRYERYNVNGLIMVK